MCLIVKLIPHRAPLGPNAPPRGFKMQGKSVILLVTCVHSPDTPWARGPRRLSNIFVGLVASVWGWFETQSAHQAIENVSFSWVSHSFLIAESRLEGNVPYGNPSPAWSSSLGLAPNALPSGFQI